MTDYDQRMQKISDRLAATDEGGQRYFHPKPHMIPSRKAVIRIIKALQAIMFPEYFNIEGEAESWDPVRQRKVAKAVVMGVLDWMAPPEAAPGGGD